MTVCVDEPDLTRILSGVDTERATLKILGIDIAVADKGTALCAGEIRGGVLHVERLDVGCGDTALVDAILDSDRVGIDAPFGWPDAFLRSVREYGESNTWKDSPVRQTKRSQGIDPMLRLRATDRAVQQYTRDLPARTANPLSVSTELIAGCAMRTAHLLTEVAERDKNWKFDRTGTANPQRQILEVYPGAALACWGVDRVGYKGTTADHAAARARIVEQFRSGLGERVAAADGFTFEQLATSDHALDAFISMLVAAATWTRHGAVPVPAIGSASRGEAKREGWIHLPEGALEQVSLDGPSD